MHDYTQLHRATHKIHTNYTHKLHTQTTHTNYTHNYTHITTNNYTHTTTHTTPPHLHAPVARLHVGAVAPLVVDARPEQAHVEADVLRRGALEHEHLVEAVPRELLGLLGLVIR